MSTLIWGLNHLVKVGHPPHPRENRKKKKGKDSYYMPTPGLGASRTFYDCIPETTSQGKYP